MNAIVILTPPDLPQQVTELATNHDNNTLVEVLNRVQQLVADTGKPDNRLANENLQWLLHWLHYADHEASHSLRQWLATQLYAPLIAQIKPVTLSKAYAPLDFIAELRRRQEQLSPLHHPLFQHIYSHQVTLREFEIYLKHKWIIMLSFWPSLAEFGARLTRRQADNGQASVATVYENVHEELGDGDPAQAHMRQHFELLRHLQMNVGWCDQPRFAATCEYINFRLFCMRHAEPAWGLGSFFSQEATSLEYTLGHYRQLRRFGIEHDYCAVYHAHDEIDAEHTREIEQLIITYATSAARQATVLTAQQQQMQLWHAHFDRVLEEIESHD